MVDTGLVAASAHTDDGDTVEGMREQDEQYPSYLAAYQIPSQIGLQKFGRLTACGLTHQEQHRGREGGLELHHAVHVDQRGGIEHHIQQGTYPAAEPPGNQREDETDEVEVDKQLKGTQFGKGGGADAVACIAEDIHE